MTSAIIMGREARRRNSWPRAVDRVGKAVTFVQVSETFDPATGSTTETTTDTAITAIPPQDFRFEQMDGSLIQSGDLVLGLPAVDMPVEPTTEDRVKMDGDIWSIVAVRPKSSGEQDALYQVQVRR